MRKDTLGGGGGGDTINARDGQVDAILCGPGQDTVTADPKDILSADCENGPVATGGSAKVAIQIVSPQSIASVVQADGRPVCGGEDRSGNYRLNYFCPVTFDVGVDPHV